MVLEKLMFYKQILQMKMEYVVLKLVFFKLTLLNKDMIKIKAVVLFWKILS